MLFHFPKHVKYYLLFLLVFGTLGTSALPREVPSISETKITIVATTILVADLLKEVVKEKHTIEVIIKSGIDPHEYQATLDDASTLTNADLIFYLGAGLEESLYTTLNNLADKSYSLFSSLPASELLIGASNQDLEDSGLDYNPHFWHNPLLVKYAVQLISQVLESKDPVNSDFYKLNADKYSENLDALNLSIVNLTQMVEAKDKFLVTQHSAFDYWAIEYGFETKSLEGVSTIDEAGIKEIDELALYLKENEIRVIFLETTVPDDSAQAVIDAAQALGWTVTVGGKLYSGSIGIDSENTYIKMMQYNTETIVQGILSPPSPTQNATFNLTYFLMSTLLIIVVVKKRTNYYD